MLPVPGDLPPTGEEPPGEGVLAALAGRESWDAAVEVRVTPRWLPELRLRAPLVVRAAPASAAGA